MNAETQLKWSARMLIGAAAAAVGIVTLPFSLPLVTATRALRAPGRVVAANVMDGTVPVVGPPLARALDGLLYEAA